MTVAGVEPECDMRELVEHPRTYAYIPHSIELYTREQLREILIKHTAELLEYPFINTPEPESYGKIVDEFMRSGGVNGT